MNDAFEIQTGRMRDEIVGRTPLEIDLWVDPDQRTAFMKQMLTARNARNLEVRLRRKDGQIRTSLASAEMIDVNGEPCILSVIADITERKQAEEAMSGFSRRLMEAQETERTRIARELHDDINQRLAMLAVGLKTAKQALPDSEVKTSRLLQEAGTQVSNLESDIQALSQQEALHNAVKYSGVEKFEVSLTGREHDIQLRVHDSGVGFNAMLLSNGHGLGLTSMKERLRSVSGELSIDSKPGHGTTVLARVPHVEKSSTSGAAA